MTKKAQMQMTETIAILFIFFLLLLFGIVFYYQYSKGAIKEKHQELTEARALDTTVRVLFLPELICSRGEAEKEENCLDLMKLRSFDTIIQQHWEDYYFHLFSYGRIVVYRLYPEPKEWIIYDKKKAEFKGYTPTFFVVSLRDDRAGDEKPLYSFGYIEIGVYS